MVLPDLTFKMNDGTVRTLLLLFSCLEIHDNISIRNIIYQAYIDLPPPALRVFNLNGQTTGCL